MWEGCGEKGLLSLHLKATLGWNHLFWCFPCRFIEDLQTEVLEIEISFGLKFNVCVCIVVHDQCDRLLEQIAGVDIYGVINYIG